jgi:hypothetical protein
MSRDEKLVKADMQKVKDIPEHLKGPNPFNTTSTTPPKNIPVAANQPPAEINHRGAIPKTQTHKVGDQLDLAHSHVARREDQ